MNVLLPRFLAHYGAHICVESRPYPGAIAALRHFQAQGHRLALCTNKPAALSRRLLTALDLDRMFAAMLGGDSLSVRKPDPRHLLEAIAQAGGDPTRACMIGDSVIDLEAARAAGVPIVLVDFGYSQVPVQTLKADAVISHFDELPAVIARLLGAGRAMP
ncbi:MAG: HAD-IIIA family hydrolase [Pseudomonadota bacterium]